jgi:catechol 2,3-dioxygenase-like lactoylglutathione lyase family enzyme
MISGAHVIIESADVEADRAFIRDMFGFESVDAGGGWLIFALPAPELAFHPGENGKHQLYLMCNDLDATLEELRARGATVGDEVSEQRWGRLGSLRLPGGGALSIYEPRHPIPSPRTLDER